MTKKIIVSVCAFLMTIMVGFAQTVTITGKVIDEKNDPVAPQIVFGCFQGRKVSDMLLDIIRKNCNTQTKVDAVRHLWGGYAWSYHFEGDN